VPGESPQPVSIAWFHWNIFPFVSLCYFFLLCLHSLAVAPYGSVYMWILPSDWIISWSRPEHRTFGNPQDRLDLLLLLPPEYLWRTVWLTLPLASSFQITTTNSWSILQSFQWQRWIFSDNWIHERQLTTVGSIRKVGPYKNSFGDFEVSVSLGNLERSIGTQSVPWIKPRGRYLSCYQINP
jgi:hypothetical protein